MGIDRVAEGEEIRTASTGGQKATKPIRYDLIPPYPLWELARVFGEAAEKKYADRNWEKGYPWSWAISALERHLNLWKAGERLDSQFSWHHLAQVIWHCMVLMVFEMQYPELDDRSKLPQIDWMKIESIVKLPEGAAPETSLREY